MNEYITKIHFIYPTDKEMKYLLDLKNKYQVSISAILDEMFNSTYLLIAIHKTKDILINGYLNKSKGKKTTIKPRLIYEMEDSSKYDMWLTNLITLFYENRLNEIIPTEKSLNKIKCQFKQKLEKKEDPYWNANEKLKEILRTYKKFKPYLKEKGI